MQNYLFIISWGYVTEADTELLQKIFFLKFFMDIPEFFTSLINNFK